MRSRFIGAVKNNPSLILYDKVGKENFVSEESENSTSALLH